MAHRLFLLLVVCSAVAASNDDWTQKCNKCKCVWSNGKRTADCTNINLSEIPTDLSSEIREIDFSNNPLHTLGREVINVRNSETSISSNSLVVTLVNSKKRPSEGCFYSSS